MLWCVATRNLTLLHFGQFVTFWADNVDQKCNSHVTKILLDFGSMSGIFLRKKNEYLNKHFSIYYPSKTMKRNVYLSISSLNPHFQQTIIFRLNILN